MPVARYVWNRRYYRSSALLPPLLASSDRYVYWGEQTARALALRSWGQVIIWYGAIVGAGLLGGVWLCRRAAVLSRALAWCIVLLAVAGLVAVAMRALYLGAIGYRAASAMALFAGVSGASLAVALRPPTPQGRPTGSEVREAVRRLR
jgi:hypothetical protein